MDLESPVDPKPSGEPIRIVEQSKSGIDEGSFVVNDEKLKKILHNDSVRNKNVCVISVAGAFRKGKSFLLNFLIKYLKEKSSESHDLRNWLSDENDVVGGFHWKSGSERDTTGIWAWSEVFVIELPSLSLITNEIAVLLVDTQGTFDSQSSVKDCVTIFALGTMLSSTLVLNLSQNIQEDDLQHLQYFTEYGKLALKKNEGKPFQKLMFLVRDWQNPDEYHYGLEGGKEFLKKKLEEAGTHKDLEDVRKGIKECFAEQECFLMPYPGNKVATSSKFTGRLEDMDADFKEHIKAFVENICSMDNLNVKKINGENVTCGLLLDLLKNYVEAFKGDELPPATTLVQITAEAHHLALLEKIKSSFDADLKKECGADRPYLTPDELEQKLGELRETAIQNFMETPKLGGGGMQDEYLKKLDAYMREACTESAKSNDHKANALVWLASGMSYIVWPVTSEQTFQKVQRFFIKGAMKLTSALRHPVDTLGRVASGVRGHIPPVPKPVEGVYEWAGSMASVMVSRVRSLIVLLMIMIVMNISSTCLGWLGLLTYSLYCQFVVMAAFLLLCAWLFAFFTGRMVTMKKGIDAGAYLVWNMFIPSPSESRTGHGPTSRQTELAQTEPVRSTSPQTGQHGTRHRGGIR